jgi:hypothetical protein
MNDFHRVAQAYIGACIDGLRRTQHEYRRRRAGFDSLFTHRPREEAGSFGYRWERVLQRLDTTSCSELDQALRAALGVATSDRSSAPSSAPVAKCD